MRIASVKINNPDAPGTSVLINASDKKDHHKLWSDQVGAWQPDGRGGLVEVLPESPAAKPASISKPEPVVAKKAGDK